MHEKATAFQKDVVPLPLTSHPPADGAGARCSAVVAILEERGQTHTA